MPRVWMPYSWKHSRSGWMVFSHLIWLKMSLGVWARWPLKDPYNPRHYMSLRSDSQHPCVTHLRWLSQQFMGSSLTIYDPVLQVDVIMHFSLFHVVQVNEICWSFSRWAVLRSASFHTWRCATFAFRLFVTPVVGLASHQRLTSNVGRAGVSSDPKVSGSGGLIILQGLTSIKAFKNDKSC